MGFAEKFIASLSSQNLRDDAVHHDLDVIAAAALAGDMGAPFMAPPPLAIARTLLEEWAAG